MLAMNLPSAVPSELDPQPPVSRRILSIDVFRGMVMFLMLAELMHLFDLAKVFPDIELFQWLKLHTTHIAWEGCSLHDLIQPGFTFLVGVAMPFSIASRLRRNQSRIWLLVHAAWRSVLLVLLGVVLRSMSHDQTYWTFEDTLSQIGLGYFFVFVIALCPRWVHYFSAAAILIGFWIAFAMQSPPVATFDYQAVGVAADWPHHHSGFASRWNLNSNLSWRLDQWFLNLFPREEPFTHNSGGYSTLSFIPTMATMIFGLWAGVWMQKPLTHTQRLIRFGLSASLGIMIAVALMHFDVVPMVKKIWTPSFALFSGGCCMVWLYLLHLLCDVRGWSRWSFPFIVIGANSILIYVMSWTVASPIRAMLTRHFGERPFEVLGPELVPQMTGVCTFAILFAVLLWLYRKQVFLKI